MLVSSLCVTYNRPNTLLQAVRYFQAQTWPRKELIVVDDSAPSDQPNLESIPNVKHVKLPHRADSGYKHDLAMEYAQGDILCYQDDDDYYGPLRIERQIQPLLDRSVDLTGVKLELIVRLPEFKFMRLKSEERRPPMDQWIGNGMTSFKWGHIWDSSAMFGRWAFSSVNKHTPGIIGQKVGFLNSLWSWGRTLKVIENDGLFLYVRHSKNSWKILEDRIFTNVPAPLWLSQDVLDGMLNAAVADGLLVAG